MIVFKKNILNRRQVIHSCKMIKNTLKTTLKNTLKNTLKTTLNNIVI